MKKALAFLAVCFVFGLAGPASAEGSLAANQPTVDPSITDGTAIREFREARAKWLAAGIRDYRIRVSRVCFCISPPDANVTVRDGRVVRVSVKHWLGPRTVPGLFQVIHQAIGRGVAELDVTYDPARGYVRRAWIDYIAPAVDDEVTYRISGFKRL